MQATAIRQENPMTKGLEDKRCDFTHHQTRVELSDPSSAVIPEIKKWSAIVKSRSSMLLLCCSDNSFIKYDIIRKETQTTKNIEHSSICDIYKQPYFQ